MKALLLTEGGIGAGMGHINRCAALAAELSSRGLQVRIGLRGDRQAKDFAGALGIATFDLESWDPAAIEGILEGEDLVVVDSYHAELACYRHLSEHVGRCLWIDDGGRLPYPRGTILNSMPGSRDLVVDAGSDPSCDLLCGPSFHPLRMEFRAPTVRVVGEEVRRILCVLGGSDPTSSTPAVMGAARRAFPAAWIRAVVPRPDQRSAWSSHLEPGMTLLGPLSASEMRAEMDLADLAICGGGQTIQEGLRMGLPMVAIEIASNQRAQMDAFLAEQAILDAGRHDHPAFPERLLDNLEEIRHGKRRRDLSERGGRLVDGLGCRRIVGHLLGWSSELRLRPAREEDSREIWTIASDPTVRACSFRTDPIPWESHGPWFRQALESRDLVFLVAEDSTGSVSAYLRAQREDTSATLSIALHPRQRGRGEGARLLREGCEIARRDFPGIERIQAWIETTNGASLGSFRSAGFVASERREIHGDRVFQLHARSASA